MKQKIKIKSNPGCITLPKLFIDGKEISHFGFKIEVNRESIPHMTAEMFLKDCEISIDGIVSIDGHPVSDEIGKQIYEQLKSRYESDGHR